MAKLENNKEKSNTNVVLFKDIEKQEFLKELTSFDKKINALVIKDEKTSEDCTFLLQTINQKKKDVKQKRDDIVKPIKSSIEIIDREYKSMFEPLERYERILKSKINDYITEQENILIKNTS